MTERCDCFPYFTVYCTKDNYLVLIFNLNSMMGDFDHKTEIALRDKDTSSVFGDEGMTVPDLLSVKFYFRPCLA